MRNILVNFAQRFEKNVLLPHLNKQGLPSIVTTRLNYSDDATDPSIKENIVSSPFSGIPVNTADNLKTFLWSKAKWMNNKALVCSVTGTNCSYGELKAVTETFGNVLLQNGFKQGQVIALALFNFIETPVMLLTAVAAGLSVCSINPDYTPDEMKHYINNSGAVGIVTFPSNLKKIEELISKLGRPLKVVVTPGTEGINKKAISSNTNMDIIYYENVFQKPQNYEEIKINTTSTDLYHVSHSSGTTGLPKAVWLSHGNFINNIIQGTSAPLIAPQNFASEKFQEVVPFVIPIFHNLALVMLLKSIYLGSTIVLLPKFDGQSFLNILDKHQASVLYVVPPLVQYLLNSPNITSKHTEHLKSIVCAGAPLTSPNLNETFKKKFPKTNLKQGYGLTEATCFLTLNTNESTKYYSVGIPIPNTKMKIVDLDTGKAQAAKAQGEICFKGPQMTKGYINNPKANAAAIDKDGWFHTGDIGYFDEKGFLFVADRLKDMIKVKGFQVSPAELEEVLLEHEYVTDAAVLGIPHPQKGEVPVAFVTTDKKIDAKQLEQEVIKFIKTRVADYKQIEKVIIVDKIPKTPSGKIKKHELRPFLK